MDQDHIDALLERYLSLLDEYTRLRTRLATLQSGVFHGIARANFSAERGFRYGRDHYDDRMQATRLLRIAVREERTGTGGDGAAGDEHGLVDFTMMTRRDGGSEEQKDKEKKKDKPIGEEVDETTSTDDATDDQIRRPQAEADADADAKESKPPKREQEDEKPKPRKSNDPLHWFGLLTPMPLRNAQAQSVEAVEHILPRLATVSAEMSSLEIEVRRARKKRTRAEAAERKEQEAKSANDNVTTTTNTTTTAVEAS